MTQKAETIRVTIEGNKPILFDAFPGVIPDEKMAKDLEQHPEKKLYLTKKNELYLPAENFYSFMCCQGKPSCINRWGPQGPKHATARKELAENILSFVSISPEEILFTRKNKVIKFTEFKHGIDASADLHLFRQAPRVQKGLLSIPQPKIRPLLNTPWSLNFEISIHPNTAHIDSDKMKGFFEGGGATVGLGAYRPRFGTFKVVGWK